MFTRKEIEEKIPNWLNDEGWNNELYTDTENEYG